MKRVLLVAAGLVALTGIAVVILIVMNARDPYGGPIEPARSH